MEVTAIVLAGGKNLRLGRDKTLEIIGGKSLIERVLERLKPLTSQIIIVTSTKPFDLQVTYKIETAMDAYPGKGPLGGIYSGLLTSQSMYNIVVACDMPFLNTELLRYMLEISSDFDAVIPRLEDSMIEPLHAVYSRSCLEKMGKKLEHNQLSVHSFLDNMYVRYIELEEIRKYDPDLLSFFNINDQTDLEQAIALATKYQI
jgi:molybdopterin-guanine dinucleotide biosynthesis protein A